MISMVPVFIILPDEDGGVLLLYNGVRNLISQRNMKDLQNHPECSLLAVPEAVLRNPVQ